MTNTIQGSGVVLSFYKDTFLPYKCFSSIRINLSTDSQGVATIKDGHWAKSRYKGLNWTVDLSGPLMIDTDNFTGFDLFENQLGFVNAIMLCSFTDSANNIKSVQGEVLISASAFSVDPGNLVKDDISMIGYGELKYFDGVVPCPTSIDSITVTGQTAADGIIHVTYTYTGPVYQVKYRTDNIGPYSYALIGDQIDIPGLSLGEHSIQIIPVCTNNYEGAEDSASFTITQNMTCSLAVTSITPVITGSAANITVVFNASIATAVIKYSVDGGALQNFIGITGPTSLTIHLTGLSIGTHTIRVVPYCSNQVPGTDMTQGFNVTSNPTLSTINWTGSFVAAGSNLSIYKNGILVVSTGANNSGSFTALNTDSVRSVLTTPHSFITRSGRLKTTDSTTTVVLNNQTYIVNPFNPFGSVEYTFGPVNGDTYLIEGTIT